MRVLYDKDYIDSNCTIGYEESYDVDNTAATYLTNYAVGVIGVIAAGVILFQFSKHTFISGIPVALFFGITGLAYAIGGIGHQLTKQQGDLVEEKILSRLSYALIAVSNSILIAIGVTLVTNNITWVIRIIWVIINLAVLLHSLITGNMFYVGVLGIIAFIGMSVVYFILYIGTRSDDGQRSIVYITKSVSMVIILVSYIVQVTLAGKCGTGDSYKNCFRDCPLPASVFNHNALFHVIFGVGLGLFAVAQLIQPDDGFEILSFFGYDQKSERNKDGSEGEINDNASI